MFVFLVFCLCSGVYRKLTVNRVFHALDSLRQRPCNAGSMASLLSAETAGSKQNHRLPLPRRSHGIGLPCCHGESLGRW